MKRACRVFALAAVLAASPVAAQDTASLRAEQIAAAEAARSAGEFDRARDILAPLLAASPDDPDLLRRMAMVDAGAGRLDVARQRIDAAAARAPNDLDIALARGFILYWNGDREAAQDSAQTIAARDPNYPELDALQRALAREEGQQGMRMRSVSVVAGLSDITLQNGASSTWNSQELAVAVDLSGADTLALGIAREKRSAVDTRLRARIDHRIDAGSIYLAASAVPDPDFQERWSVGGGGELNIARNVSVLVDMRVAEYDTGTIVAVQPGLRYTFSRNASVTGRAINIFDDDGTHRLGGSARFDYAFANDASLFVIGASYPDAEADGVRQLRSVAAGVTIPLADALAITAAASHEDRKNSYRRWAGTLALTFRFGAP